MNGWQPCARTKDPARRSDGVRTPPQRRHLLHRIGVKLDSTACARHVRTVAVRAKNTPAITCPYPSSAEATCVL
jgi:hypothetical protein